LGARAGGVFVLAVAARGFPVLDLRRGVAGDFCAAAVFDDAGPVVAVVFGWVLRLALRRTGREWGRLFSTSRSESWRSAIRA
jgi:hypothetical protein